MSEQTAAAPRFVPVIVNACWNQIGVHGDRSCPELTSYVHCRNCPVFASGAARLLDGEAPAGYLGAWTTHVAQTKTDADGETQSIVIFRIGAEWLALPSIAVTEVANVLPVHSLPHRRDGVVLGLANVRGELLICVSLGAVVGAIPAAASEAGGRGAAYRRLLVIRGQDVRVVCPVDEVHGIHRVRLRDLKNVPATVAQAPVTYSTALLSWRERSVGLLDHQLVFYSIKRSLG